MCGSLREKGKELLFWVRKKRRHVCFAAQEKTLNENE